jgi:hypothetical protein
MDGDWWFVRLSHDTEEAEAQAQTRYENDCDAARKGE